MTPLSEKGFKILNRMNRKMPDYLSPVWQGFDEPTTDECLLGENFSIYLNPKHLGIGAGVGGLVGLSYGYWDYNDAKKQAAKKGLQKPDKKKILIRDTLIGMGLGTAASPLATMLLKTLENKRVSQSQKDTFDKLELDILKGNDKPKLLALLNNYKNDITPEQYNTLKTLVDATSEKKFNEPKINKPPVKEMPYNEKIARTRDSLPSPINEKGEIDLEAVKKIQSKLSPYESSQFLQKFGVRMKDVINKQKLQSVFVENEQIKKAAEIAKQKVTPEMQKAIREEDERFKKLQEEADEGQSKTTKDLADALFSSYFSNKAQIFRNYNAQKKRGF